MTPGVKRPHFVLLSCTSQKTEGGSSQRTRVATVSAPLAAMEEKARRVSSWNCRQRSGPALARLLPKLGVSTRRPHLFAHHGRTVKPGRTNQAPAGTPARARRTASSAASARPPSGPPACARSGRPPPPLPPTAALAARTRSTASTRPARSAETPHDDAGLALGGRDERNHAAAHVACRIASAMPFSSRAGTSPRLRAASLTSPTFSHPRRAAAGRQLPLQIGNLALQPPPLLEQRPKRARPAPPG